MSRSSAAAGDGGFTLVELLVTMLVMGLIATAIINLAIGTFTDTATITNRRDVFAEGRTALDRLAKQLRQGESVNTTASTSSTVVFSTYINNAAATVAWRAQGSSAPYKLQESRNGGTSYATVVDALSSPVVFTYTTHGGVLDQVTIDLTLVTTTSTVHLQSDVYLRNAQS
jgi:prepilin-type N-terminal cleavage/methylation domain-containing protein